jgi:hypothetical protein
MKRANAKRRVAVFSIHGHRRAKRNPVFRYESSG